MLLYRLIELKSLIEDKKENMYAVAQGKALTDPCVVTVSQEIDEIINSYQRIISSIHK